MTPLESFVLVGVIMSHDTLFSTVEFNINPQTNGGPSIAILPNAAIPCDIEIGKTIYVVKEKSQDIPVISCEAK